MGDIEIKRGYEILSENKLRFGLRLTNSSSTVLSEVEVILDWNKTLFEIEGGASPIQNLGTIPPYLPRTAEYILKIRRGKNPHSPQDPTTGFQKSDFR